MRSLSAPSDVAWDAAVALVSPFSCAAASRLSLARPRLTNKLTTTIASKNRQGLLLPEVINGRVMVPRRYEKRGSIPPLSVLHQVHRSETVSNGVGTRADGPRTGTASAGAVCVRAQIERDVRDPMSGTPCLASEAGNRRPSGWGTNATGPPQPHDVTGVLDSSKSGAGGQPQSLLQTGLTFWAICTRLLRRA